MDCGNGNLDHQNSTRSQENRTASSVSAKTQTARCWLAGTAEFTVSLTAKRSCIRFPDEWARSELAGCFVTVTVVCGSELSMRGLYMYTNARQTYLGSHRASQVKPVTCFLKIAKAMSGWERGAASIVFVTSLSLRF